MEASGTSGMKAAINGTLTLATRWLVDESFNGKKRFAIGHGEELQTSKSRNNRAGTLTTYSSRSMCQCFTTGNPTAYRNVISYMKNCITSIAGMYSTTRMLKEYTQNYI
jgi:glucan phosphorylase